MGPKPFEPFEPFKRRGGAFHLREGLNGLHRFHGFGHGGRLFDYLGS